METYHGHVRTPADAIILFEACRRGLLPRVQRRLSEKERQTIMSGSIFVWDEREAGMRRWTDGKSWSASRVSGSFLTYREMEGKRGGNGLSTPLFSGNTPKASREKSGDLDNTDDGPDGYRYKPDGLMKQSFSITTSSGQHLHLISYYSRTGSANQNMMQPSADPQLRHIRPEKGMYPESTGQDHESMPAVTRGPMPGPSIASAEAHPPAGGLPYGRPPPSAAYPGYSTAGWAPPSPLHTPPPHYQHFYGNSPHQYSPYTYGPHPSHPTYQTSLPPMPAPTRLDRVAPSLPAPHHLPHFHHSMPYGSSHSQLAPSPTSHPERHALPPASLTTPPNHMSTEHRLGEARHDSMHPKMEEPPYSRERKSLTPPLVNAPLTFGTTIPSISSLINGAQAAAEEQQRRHASTSPGIKQLARPLQDIPLHKLAFSPANDARALRDLDKATFRV